MFVRDCGVFDEDGRGGGGAHRRRRGDDLDDGIGALLFRGVVRGLSARERSAGSQRLSGIDGRSRRRNQRRVGITRRRLQQHLRSNKKDGLSSVFVFLVVSSSVRKLNMPPSQFAVHFILPMDCWFTLHQVREIERN